MKMIFEAISEKNIPLLISCIILGEVNAIDSMGFSPALYAIFNNDLKILKLLIANGADVNKKDKLGFSLIFYALRAQKYEIFKYLLSSGASLENINPRDLWFFLQYFVQARNFEELFFIARYFLFSDIRGADDVSVLHIAAQYNYSDLCEFFINCCVNVDVVDKQGRTPLHYAVICTSVEAITRLLQNSANPNLRSLDGKAPLHLVLEKFDFENNKNLLDLLLNYGADADGADSVKQKTPLHLAAQSGNDYAVKMLTKSVTSNSLSSLKKAKVSRVSNVDVQDIDGNTPLFLAATEGNATVVSHLIHCGANPNARNNEGKYALHCGVASDQPTVIEVLLEGGANPFVTDSNNQMPIHSALVRKKESIISILAEKMNFDCELFKLRRQLNYFFKNVRLFELLNKQVKNEYKLLNFEDKDFDNEFRVFLKNYLIEFSQNNNLPQKDYLGIISLIEGFYAFNQLMEVSLVVEKLMKRNTESLILLEFSPKVFCPLICIEPAGNDAFVMSIYDYKSFLLLPPASAKDVERRKTSLYRIIVPNALLEKILLLVEKARYLADYEFARDTLLINIPKLIGSQYKFEKNFQNKPKDNFSFSKNIFTVILDRQIKLHGPDEGKRLNKILNINIYEAILREYITYCYNHPGMEANVQEILEFCQLILDHEKQNHDEITQDTLQENNAHSPLIISSIFKPAPPDQHALQLRHSAENLQRIVESVLIPK